MSQGPNSGGEKKGKGKRRKREKDAGTFRVPGGLLFKTREEAEQYLREAIGDDSDGDKWDDEGDGSDEGEDKGDGCDKRGGKGGEEGSPQGG